MGICAGNGPAQDMEAGKSHAPLFTDAGWIASGHAAVTIFDIQSHRGAGELEELTLQVLRDYYAETAAARLP